MFSCIFCEIFSRQLLCITHVINQKRQFKDILKSTCPRKFCDFFLDFLIIYLVVPRPLQKRQSHSLNVNEWALINRESSDFENVQVSHCVTLSRLCRCLRKYIYIYLRVTFHRKLMSVLINRCQKDLFADVLQNKCS